MEENLYMPNCIRTFSGIYVNIINPDPETILIEDISHGLSMQPRFGGHLKHFYSVAEHCIFCYRIADEHYRLDALMHDASEAYLIDIPSPVKNLIPNYKEIENRFMDVISHKFGFSWPMIEEVKLCDETALKYEWDKYMIGGSRGRSSLSSERLFLNAFNDIKNG